MGEAVLVFPAGLSEGLAYKDRAKAQGLRVVGASSLDASRARMPSNDPHRARAAVENARTAAIGNHTRARRIHLLARLIRSIPIHYPLRPSDLHILDAKSIRLTHLRHLVSRAEDALALVGLVLGALVRRAEPRHGPPVRRNVDEQLGARQAHRPVFRRAVRAAADHSVDHSVHRANDPTWIGFGNSSSRTMRNTMLVEHPSQEHRRTLHHRRRLSSPTGRGAGAARSPCACALLPGQEPAAVTLSFVAVVVPAPDLMALTTVASSRTAGSAGSYCR